MERTLPGEISVGGLPGLGFRIGIDQVAQFGDDFAFGFAVELTDERQIDLASLVKRDQESFLGGFHFRHRRDFADHVPLHDGGLGRFAGDLVVILQRHDEHGVRVFPEFDQIGHAANDRAIGFVALNVVLLIGP